MNLTHLSELSFLIVTSTGRKILINPFYFFSNSKPYDSDVDIVINSTQVFETSPSKQVNYLIEQISDVTDFTFEDIKITTYPSYADSICGLRRGSNLISKIEGEGFTILHLGYLSHILTDSEISMFKNIDILLLPVGGNFMLDSSTAFELYEKINPKIVIPMGYKSPDVKINLSGLDEFLSLSKSGIKLNPNSISVKSLVDDFEGLVIL